MLKIPRQVAKLPPNISPLSISVFFCICNEMLDHTLQSLDGAQEEVDAVFVNAALSAIQQRNLEVTPLLILQQFPFV